MLKKKYKCSNKESTETEFGTKLWLALFWTRPFSYVYLPYLPELEFCPERVQTEEWTDVGHHPGVHLAVTPEVRLGPETHLVRSREIFDGEEFVFY